MKTLFGFLASSVGRWTRAIAGVVLIAVGLLSVGGIAGYVFAIVGLVPLAAGILDFCVFAPLFSLPFNGSELRTAAQSKPAPHAHAH